VIEVLFFASLREALGCDRISIETDTAITLDQLHAELKRRFPAERYRTLLDNNIRVAVNQELTTGVVRLNPGCEVAFLPPVTGG